MVWPAIIGAVGGLAAGWLGYKGQKEANATNIDLSQEQMDFQERMSNTSYQRAVEDMQAAGLNPMLAYSQGGASAPLGSMPQVQNAVGAGVSSAAQSLGVMQGYSNVLAQSAQIEKVKAETARIKAETLSPQLYELLANYRGSKDYQSANLMSQQQLTESQRYGLVQAQTALEKILGGIAGVKLDVDTSSFSADVARRKAESDLRVLDIPRMKAEEKFFNDLGQANPYLRQLLMLLKSVGSAASIGR